MTNYAIDPTIFFTHFLSRRSGGYSAALRLVGRVSHCLTLSRHEGRR